MTGYHYRPELHVTADHGILNAPAGALRDGDTWHVFHQYRAEPDGPARWSHHARGGEDGAEWEPYDDVLAPEGDETNVRAGSAVVSPSGVTGLFFTSVTAEGASIALATIDSLAATTETISDDRLAVDTNVRRRGIVLGDGGGYKNLRSPCVVQDWRGSCCPIPTSREDVANFDCWMMLAVEGPEDQPRIVVAASTGWHDWHIEGPLTFRGETGIPTGGRIVSPRILNLVDEVDDKSKDILFVTIEHDGGRDESGYVVGTLSGTLFTVQTPFTTVDHGHDFTRPRGTAVSSAGRGPGEREALVFGLMSRVSRGDHPEHHPSYVTEHWANCLSLARLTTLQGGRLFFTPTTRLVDSVTFSHHALTSTTVMDIPTGGSVSVAVESEDGPIARVTHYGNRIVVDRSMSPRHIGDAPAQAGLAVTDTNAVTVIVDGSTLEVFADGGAVAMASRLWADSAPTGFTVTTHGGATVLRHLEFGPLTSTAALVDELFMEAIDVVPTIDD